LLSLLLAGAVLDGQQPPLWATPANCESAWSSAVDLEAAAVVEPLFELFHGTADDDSLPLEVCAGVCLHGCGG
jgi:hypothetical protein